MRRRLVADRRDQRSRVPRSWDACRFFRASGPLGPWTRVGRRPGSDRRLGGAAGGPPLSPRRRRCGGRRRIAARLRRRARALPRRRARPRRRSKQTVMRRFAPRGGLHTFNASERFVGIDTAAARAEFPGVDGFGAMISRRALSLAGGGRGSRSPSRAALRPPPTEPRRGGRPRRRCSMAPRSARRRSTIPPTPRSIAARRAS